MKTLPLLLVTLSLTSSISYSPDISAQIKKHSISSLPQTCDYIVPSNHHLFDGQTSGVQAGETICLEGGERGPLRLTNIKGSQEEPVLVRNEGALVTTQPYEYSVAIEGSQWLRITSIKPDIKSNYGLRLGGTLSIGKLSSNIEVDHIEIYRARFAGMLVKTDPNCDPATWQENFTMTGIHIHDNYIHDTEEGEGMYVGYTGKSRTLECDGVVTVVYPHLLEGIAIFNNILENIAADGIQLNAVKQDSYITNNRIYLTGISPFSPYWQNTGIQVGGNDVVVSNNVIFKSGGNGMMLDGDGLIIRDNNIFYSGENGIFARNPAQQDVSLSNGKPHEYRNNLIVQSNSYGIKLYAVNTSSPNRLIANTIENNGQLDVAGRPMTFSYLNNNVLVEESYNRHYVVTDE